MVFVYYISSVHLHDEIGIDPENRAGLVWSQHRNRRQSPKIGEEGLWVGICISVTIETTGKVVNGIVHSNGIDQIPNLPCQRHRLGVDDWWGDVNVIP